MGPDRFAALSGTLPESAIQIVLVLFLSFLIGLEREEHKTVSVRYTFGGVRTFPFIGLIGYAVSLLAGGQAMAIAIGFAVVGGFLALSFHHKLSSSEAPGVTTEMSGLATYLVGALVYQKLYWVAVTVSVASVLLLELKTGLEGLTKRVPGEEIFNFTKFLLLTAVILPVLPNHTFGAFQINPFKTWLVVVAVSAVSYASYVLQKVTRASGGVLLAALLGGAYSSTATTIVLARRASREERPHLFAGATLMASGVMYLRLAALLAIFNRGLMVRLGSPFCVTAALAVAAGWLWSRRAEEAGKVSREYEPPNPLELKAAFLFAILFVVMLVATHLAVTYLGRAGVYGLGAIMGVTDVDPFIMGLTQSAGTLTPIGVATVGIVIAAASNNVVKGIYAYCIATRAAGRESLYALLGLAAAGLVPLIWLAR